MLQDLAALAPPVIVCAAVLAGVWVLVRKELAPKRRPRTAPDRDSDNGAAEPAREPADREQGRS